MFKPELTVLPSLPFPHGKAKQISIKLHNNKYFCQGEQLRLSMLWWSIKDKHKSF